MVVVGELTNKEERPGHTKVEWSIPRVWSFSENYDFYKSHSFEFAGEQWHLRLDARSFFLPVLLYKEASPRAGSVHVELAYKNAHGTLVSCGEHSHTFTAAENKDCLFSMFLPELSESSIHRFFMRRELAPSDNLTLVLSFRTEVHDRLSLPTWTADIPSNQKPVNEALEFVDASTQTKSDNCTDKLSSDLSQLLLDGENSDLTIRVKGTEFRLHRIIMGVRTPVFSAMLRHDMQEKATGVVCIDDFEPEVFQAFVRYLYSGMVKELTIDTVFDLFSLADKYRVDELKSCCLEFIRGSLSVDTFCDVLNVALTYEQRDLLVQVKDFFAKHMKDILKTVKWMNFMRDNHIQANELILTGIEKNNL